MQLFNIGAEGQLYIGAICAAGRRDLARARTTPSSLTILAMCVCGAAGGALWALIPGVLKAFARTNEIITTLMLNYVAGLLLTYLIFDSASPWRDVSTIQTRSFPQSIALQPSQFWPTLSPGRRRRPVRLPARARGRRSGSTSSSARRGSASR